MILPFWLDVCSLTLIISGKSTSCFTNNLGPFPAVYHGVIHLLGVRFREADHLSTTSSVFYRSEIARCEKYAMTSFRMKSDIKNRVAFLQLHEGFWR